MRPSGQHPHVPNSLRRSTLPAPLLGTLETKLMLGKAIPEQLAQSHGRTGLVKGRGGGLRTESLWTADQLGSGSQGWVGPTPRE